MGECCGSVQVLVVLLVLVLALVANMVAALCGVPEPSVLVSARWPRAAVGLLLICCSGGTAAVLLPCGTFLSAGVRARSHQSIMTPIWSSSSRPSGDPM